MIEVSFLQMAVFLAVLWICFRSVVYIKNKKINWRWEARQSLVLMCIIFITRYVYFPLELVDGHIGKMIFDPDRIQPVGINITTFIQRIINGQNWWQENFYQNIELFLPFGIVFPFCFKKLNNVLKVTASGFVYSLFIELSQMLLCERYTDVDDIIANTLGAMFGSVIYFVALMIWRKIKKYEKAV